MKKKSHESTKSMKNYKFLNLKKNHWNYYIRKRNKANSTESIKINTMKENAMNLLIYEKL